ncbi:MAG: hypothetical protein EPO22_01270 [Dehalococcoidia bacterium]|nr:MAG: hypothetical protein EPO22_01270 [Dehalococcoidia bacterium]
MRIAGRRTLAAPLPARLLLALYAAMALAAAGFMIAAAVRFATRTTGGDDRPSVAMADVFGIGGLPELSAGRTDAEAATSPVQRNAIVTYYGSPSAPSMGILGQHAPEEVADLLTARAERFRFATGGGLVLPALHLVYAVAQPQASDGLYLQYLDDRTVQQFQDLARRRGFVLILDLQIGHGDPLAEVKKIEPYLLQPDVFVALDPEFALAGGARPGDAIGSIDARDINAVQQYLADLTTAHHLPKKMLVVHQFQEGMISNADAIQRRADVDLVIDMDGYGPADIKQVKYLRYGAAPYAPYGGIKIFLQHDPDPLTERQLLGLNPRPSLFVYQ